MADMAVSGGPSTLTPEARAHQAAQKAKEKDGLERTEEEERGSSDDEGELIDKSTFSVCSVFPCFLVRFPLIFSPPSLNLDSKRRANISPSPYSSLPLWRPPPPKQALEQTTTTFPPLDDHVVQLPLPQRREVEEAGKSSMMMERFGPLLENCCRKRTAA